MSATSVIITAGGIGTRMKAEIPKQFLEINGLPILMHTITRFYEALNNVEIIITLPEPWIGRWKKLCSKHEFTIPHTIVVGGAERFYSIKNAIEKCTADVIMIHDGVRPCVNSEFLKRCLKAGGTSDAVIPVLKISESIRQMKAGRSIAVDRNQYLLVQTPQVFKGSVLKHAYNQPFSEEFTDDASVVEKAGYTISMIEGVRENIKITTPEDLDIVSGYLK